MHLRTPTKLTILILIFASLATANIIVLYQYKEENTASPSTEADHFRPQSWLDFPWAIAHAGGALRKKGETATYTNSREAFTQNYQLGHRVFEFDFYPTSDDNLALVHDWESQGNKDGLAMSTENWRHFDAGYTTMVIGDLLDLMMEYPDFYVVTDTKLADESSRREFEILYREASRRDIGLLDRFVPQIYNHEMYDYISDIYNWRSMIYTVYQTSYQPEDVINFASTKPEIKVVTVPMDDPRYDEETVSYAHNQGLLIFNHTPNTYPDITKSHAIGVDGFYVDYLLPDDIDLLYTFD